MGILNFWICIAFLVGVFFGAWAPFWLEIIGFLVVIIIYKTWFDDRELESLYWIFMVICFTIGLFMGDSIVFLFVEHNSVSSVFESIWNVIIYPFTHRL